MLHRRIWLITRQSKSCLLDSPESIGCGNPIQSITIRSQGGRGLIAERAKNQANALLMGRRRGLTTTHKHEAAHPSVVAKPAIKTTKQNRGSWQFAAKIGAGAALLVLGSAAAIGVYGAKKINFQRPRWFADEFVLTPESLRMPYTQVIFSTEDGIPLRGWYIQQTVRGKPSEKVVLLCSPYLHPKSTLLAIARGLWEHGCSVFLFDFRSHAPIPTTQTCGYLEERDGKAALRQLRKLAPDNAQIAIVGCSMGGSVALCVTADELANLRPIVACATDCAFATLKDAVRLFIVNQNPGPSFIVDPVVELICFFNEVLYGYNVERVGPQRLLGNITCPLLILHNVSDSIVPVSSATKIYSGVSTPKDKKEMIIVSGEHISSFFHSEQMYIRRLISFLDQCFTEDDDEMKRPLDLVVGAAPTNLTKATPSQITTTPTQ